MRVALLAGVFLLAANGAHAQQATVTNTQDNLRGSSAVTDIIVGHAYDAGATSVASGNAAASTGENANVTLDNTQHAQGDSSAVTNSQVGSADGTIATASAAIANGVTAAAANGDVTLRSTQSAHGNANANSYTFSGSAAAASTSAAASGNVAAVSADSGGISAAMTQDSSGQVTAAAEAQHCCDVGQAVADAIASHNNVSVAGHTSTSITETHQTAAGLSEARSDLSVGRAGDAVSNATANGNALTVDNQWGYVNAHADQQSSANVAAHAQVSLGQDFAGFASAGAYGVGNSTVVSNVGSDTVMDVAQDNSGAISADATMAGTGGDAALASSAAYGNVTTGSLCAYCDGGNPTLTANNNQTNSGDVHASASVNAPYANTVAATSSAIGNAATFQVTGPGG